MNLEWDTQCQHSGRFPLLNTQRSKGLPSTYPWPCSWFNFGVVYQSPGCKLRPHWLLFCICYWVWTHLLTLLLITYSSLLTREINARAVVPNTLGTRDPFCGEQFFHRLDEGIVLEWFKLVTFGLHSIIITSAPPQLSSIRSQRLGSPALGNALAIQGLGLCTLTDKDQGSTPGLGTKMPQAMLHGQKEKKREREKETVKQASS